MASVLPEKTGNYLKYLATLFMILFLCVIFLFGFDNSSSNSSSIDDLESGTYELEKLPSGDYIQIDNLQSTKIISFKVKGQNFIATISINNIHFKDRVLFILNTEGLNQLSYYGDNLEFSYSVE